ncbi:DUF1302 family protein [Pontibacter sp. JAM-7]|uniref:DUF1302 family protein n=1 Tax=Pontibacter sp. JAM-7 TaxID=3366581 RepID=UPI003AF83588
MKKKNNMMVGAVLAGAGLLMGSAATAGEGDYSINFGGYLRAQTAMFLEDQEETEGDDTGDLGMARMSLQLEMDAKTGNLAWKAIGRIDKEHQTSYLDDLEDMTRVQSPGGSATTEDYLDQFQTDSFEDFLREFYVDFSLGDRVDVRLGRQQLVWGESDFFQAMDLIHGYDYRKRLFFENNEDWRKPLTLANFNIDVSELDGSLNLFVRPGGIDRDEDMGSNFNLEGGRWIPHPYRGVDFTAFTDYNTDHKDGDWDDTTYGIRWNGFAGSVGYSFAYLKTFNPQPIMNPAANSVVPGLFGVTSMQSYGELATNQVLGDWVFPEIDVFGLTVNGYSVTLDSTLSAEFAFIPDKPYNFGNLQSSLPGWGGVIEKDTLVTMLRLDKELRLMDWLGTNRPSLSSIQLFDTWIMDYDKDDEIVEFASFGARKKEHTTYLTLFTLLNFKRDTINPSFVIGTDLSNGGGFAIPAIEFVFGDDWRLKAEADLWWNDGDKKHVAPGEVGLRNPLGTSENSASLFDWFSDDNQLVFSLTRQF